MKLFFHKQWPYLLLIIIVSLFCLPLFTNIFYPYSRNDWCEIYSLYSAARKSVLEFYQFPLRSHLIEGGYPLIAHPYDSSLNPLFIFVLLFGEVAGTKIICYLMYLAGGLGMYWLAKKVMGFNTWGALFSSFTFSLGGWLPAHLLDGSFTKCYYYLLPFLLGCFLQAEKHPKYIFYISALLFLFFTSTGLSFLAVVFFIFVFAVLKTLVMDEKKISVRPFYPIVLSVSLVLLLLWGAVKFIPLVCLSGGGRMAAHRETSYLTVSSLIDAFTRSGSESFSAAYVGVIPLLFFLLSFLWWRSTVKYIAVLIVMIGVGFGPNCPVNFWAVVQKLPVFNLITRPDQYFSGIIFFIVCLLSGQVFSRISLIKAAAVRRFVIVLIAGLSLISFANQFFSNIQYHFKLKRFAFQVLADSPSVFFPVKIRIPPEHQICEEMLLQYSMIKKNRQLIKPDYFMDIFFAVAVIPKYYLESKKNPFCLNERLIEVHRHRPAVPFIYYPVANPAYRGEAYFLNSDNKSKLDKLTPNQIVITARIEKGDMLIINQNFHSGWRVSSIPGRPVDKVKILSYNGLLAVALAEPGSYRIILTYRPSDFLAGAVISITSFLLVVVLIISRKEKLFYVWKKLKDIKIKII